MGLPCAEFFSSDVFLRRAVFAKIVSKIYMFLEFLGGGGASERRKEAPHLDSGGIFFLSVYFWKFFFFMEKVVVTLS